MGKREEWNENMLQLIWPCVLHRSGGGGEGRNTVKGREGLSKIIASIALTSGKVKVI